MAAVTSGNDFGAQKNKVSHRFHYFSIYLPWSDGTKCHDLSFLNVEFQANLFILLFHCHQEALQFFFILFHKVGVICIPEVIDISPAVLIPACASSSLAFLMTYSAYRESWHAAVHGVAKSQKRLSDWTELNSAYELNKQGDNTQKFMPIYTYISIYIYLKPPVSTQQNRAYSTAPSSVFLHLYLFSQQWKFDSH